MTANGTVTEPSLQFRRTGADVAVGILLIIGALIALGDTVLATALSVRLVGWVALVSGLVAVIGAFFNFRSGRFRSSLIIGGLLTVLGLIILRNPLAAALTLTLIAGFMFLSGGVLRIGLSFEDVSNRLLLALSGAASLVLGLIVLFNIVTASLSLLGWLIGIQLLIDGMTLLAYGRLRVTSGTGQ